MKIILQIYLLFYILFLSVSSYSQDNYLQGFIVTSEQDTVTGLINFKDWEVNPKKVEFKKDATAEQKMYTPLNITAFGVAGYVFMGSIVDVENSPIRIANLSSTPTEKITQDTVFLKTLIRGEKSLYSYKKLNGDKNFYVQENGEFVLLVYKKYSVKIGARSNIAENNKFIGQLTLYLNDCPGIKSSLPNLEYTQKSLEKLFVTYYQCTKSDYVRIIPEKEKITVEGGLIAGLSITDLKLNSSFYDFLPQTDYNTSYNFSGGVLLDLIMPRNLKKLSLYNELILSTFKISGTYTYFYYEDLYTDENTMFKYAYLKLNNMLRYKILLNNYSIFLNVGISNGIAISSYNHRKQLKKIYSMDYTKESEAFASENYEMGILGGIGAQSKRWTLDVRYELGSGISQGNYSQVDSSTRRIYVLIGYRFKKKSE
ncbi:MAG: PorT family protein [Cyclobacteriaceae bacterium]|nr:PorT family protein [Cyclobacteriaceae bacterium]